MGLDVSHGCWSGGYSSFNNWRRKLAALVGLPLDIMEGYWEPRGPQEDTYGILEALPVPWSLLAPDPLWVLLNHSDCDGTLAWQDCLALAERLEGLLPELPDGSGPRHIGDWKECTQDWATGLRLAHERKEDVEFG